MDPWAICWIDPLALGTTPPLVWALHAWLVENRMREDAYKSILRLLVAADAEVRPEWVDDDRVATTWSCSGYSHRRLPPNPVGRLEQENVVGRSESSARESLENSESPKATDPERCCVHTTNLEAGRYFQAAPPRRAGSAT